MAGVWINSDDPTDYPPYPESSAECTISSSGFRPFRMAFPTSEYGPTEYDLTPTPPYNPPVATPLDPYSNIARGLNTPFIWSYPAHSFGDIVPDHLIDPNLTALDNPPVPTTTSSLILPQLSQLVVDIEHTVDENLLIQLPLLTQLIEFLSQFDNFGLANTNNLPNFRQHVQHTLWPHLPHTPPHQYDILNPMPEKELKMMFRVSEELYTFHFPGRFELLMYPDDFMPTVGEHVVETSSVGDSGL